MRLEDYFDFNHPNGIRISGTRVNLEDVVYLALDGHSPGFIRQNLPSLTLEQVHAALTYFYGHRSEIESYMRMQDEEFDQDAAETEVNSSSELKQRILAKRRERAGAS